MSNKKRDGSEIEVIVGENVLTTIRMGNVMHEASILDRDESCIYLDRLMHEPNESYLGPYYIHENCPYTTILFIPKQPLQ